MDYEVLKSKSEDSIKKYNSVSSENIRLKQDVADLSRQVTVLLYEVEQLRSKMVSGLKSSASNYFKDPNETSSYADSTLANLFGNNEDEVSSSSEIANRNAFLFRNIEEMHKQNQKLVRMLNEITDKKQSEEKSELESKTREYTEKLTMALRELEEIRNQREKQEHVLEEIRKQRDTYKSLLNQPKEQQQQQGASSFFTSTPGIDQRTKMRMSRQPSDQFSEHNTSQQCNDTTVTVAVAVAAAHETLQKQFDKYQEEMAKTTKALNEEIEKYRTSNTDLNLRVALADSKLESAVEKCKSMGISIEKYRKEIETLKERHSKV